MARDLARRLPVGTLGATLPSPVMTMSFMALSVVPELKLTDRGLVDVDRFKLVPLEVLPIS